MLAVRAERAADLRAAVAALPEPYREVVTLRFFGELSLDEIARQTDRPLARSRPISGADCCDCAATVEPGGDA